MKFNYIQNDKLPKLAWATVLEQGREKIIVYHGSNIETTDDFFVEGSWNGKYEDGKFDISSFFMGSGVKLNNEKALFVTPTHTLERLYTITKDNKIFVSNSLPFILYISDSKLKIDYFKYEQDLNTILNGSNQYKKYIPLENNDKLYLYYYCNFYIDKELNIKIENKKSLYPFKTFGDYYSSLQKDLKIFISNANSKKRKINYDLVTTISKGYDATACAVVAKDLGCDTAVTFNAPEKYREDSGEEIAEKLGYKKIIKQNANNYLKNNNLIEAEFVSSGELGTGIVFTAFEQDFQNKIVFFGERGDRIWDKNSENPNKFFQFKEEVYSGTSMIENRLKTGYIYLPLPLYGAQNWKSIHEISNSNELRSYSVGGDYDRPIPRKIIEDRGVPRTEFGSEKKGAGFNYRFDNLKRLEKRMSEKSYRSFYGFYKKHHKPTIKRFMAQINYLWETKDIYINFISKKNRHEF